MTLVDHDDRGIGERRAGRPVAFCVCVPSLNEAERLPVLLGALVVQDHRGMIPVVVTVNNTTDNSIEVLQDLQATHADRLDIKAYDVRFPPNLAHAGSARAHAMNSGLELVGEDGVLLTTDADARPPSDWISENLRAIAQGVDIVGGRLVIDEREALPSAVLQARVLWDRYWEIVRGIEDAVDPRPHDPAPRHGDHTGASLAITTRIYRAAGGVPLLPLGEDRALVNAAIAAGGRLAHPPAVWTRVSPRRDGRAGGGMAQAMIELHEAAGSRRVTLAPSLDHWRERARWRRTMRDRADADAWIAREEDNLPPMPCDTPLASMVAAP